MIRDKSSEVSCWRGAGRTDVSSSSSGSGEAETLDLKLRTTAEMAAGSSGHLQQQHAATAGEEPTVMVNRAPRPGLGRPALSGLRAGPRRTGMTHFVQLFSLYPSHYSSSISWRVCCF